MSVKENVGNLCIIGKVIFLKDLVDIVVLGEKLKIYEVAIFSSFWFYYVCAAFYGVAKLGFL